MTSLFRRARHGRGQEYCDAYVKHWHIGPFILWSK